ncbi:hypothetical protein D8S78_05555 [Natrialba swarupiae]|nr:hypothetical protein [Natrialba swarupiae]
MGLFEDLGRKVGKFTHEAKQAADEGTPTSARTAASASIRNRSRARCGGGAVVEREQPADESADDSSESDPE